VENTYLTGVEKILAGRNLTAESVKSWIYPMKFCEADPCRDFFGVETINCGPASPAPLNSSQKRSEADLTKAKPIFLGRSLFFRGRFANHTGVENW